MGHSGGRSSGDRSHSLICDPISHWRALRRMVSRAVPGGSNLASSLKRLASSERRSSRDWVCLKRRRCVMTFPLALAGPTPHGSALGDPNMRSGGRPFRSNNSQPLESSKRPDPWSAAVRITPRQRTSTTASLTSRPSADVNYRRLPGSSMREPFDETESYFRFSVGVLIRDETSPTAPARRLARR
jgi:hypothetical protein